jgi:hypothetical protein
MATRLVFSHRVFDDLAKRRRLHDTGKVIGEDVPLLSVTTRAKGELQFND